MLVMGMGVMLMLMSRRTNRMQPITAGAHIFESLVTIVRLRSAMQLKLEVLVILAVSRQDLFKRPSGTVRALWGGPPEIFRCWRSSALAKGASDRHLGATPLSARRRADAIVTTPVASLALGTRIN